MVAAMRHDMISDRANIQNTITFTHNAKRESLLLRFS
jgi:hypothetical protein